MRFILLSIIFFFCSSFLNAQNTDSLREVNNQLDSLYIVEVQDKYKTDKVLHAEPLYIDLIRDLGARKGEKEWNVGAGLTDNINYDKYKALVEYEFAPINRLGLEIELPFTFYFPTANNANAPKSLLNSLKLAAQYSFYVSEKNKMSMAAGYIHEFGFTEFANYGEGKFFTGNMFNPFFVVAKRWGQNFHTLIYSSLEHHSSLTSYQINSNLHYMIPGTRNFVGMEFNKHFEQGNFDMVIRPQMRVGITDQLLVGIVTGIPVSRNNERFSTFLRLIYEPKHRN